jgi:class 3 adenylate cyclase
VKYGEVGPAVNLLARIQTLTGGGEVLISEALLARVAASVNVGPGRVARVKGATEPVTVHRVLGVRPAGAPAVTSLHTD